MVGMVEKAEKVGMKVKVEMEELVLVPEKEMVELEKVEKAMKMKNSLKRKKKFGLSLMKKGSSKSGMKRMFPLWCLEKLKMTLTTTST